MFAKLAARNVRRQIGNYLIYFITVSLTVALMFAVNNVIFSEQLLAHAETMQELKSGLIAITVFVSLIVAFVLGYATSFMLKLRQREFGTYLTLGMTRRNILSIFVLETLILCAAALAVGMLLGLFLYQGLMLLMTSLMEMEVAFASYSAKGLLLTVVLVSAIFLLSSVASALYLKRVSIHRLLHGDRIVEKGVRHPAFWMAVTLLSIAAVAGSCAAFSDEIEKALVGGQSSAGGLFGSLTLLAAALVLFHIGLARSVVNLLLKSRRFCSRGTNTFTLRQLSGKLGANSVLAGALAFLIAFAVIGANVSFVQKVSEQAALNQQYPFDINVNLDAGEEPPVDVREAEAIIGRYAPIRQDYAYSLYTTGKGYLHSFTSWTGEGYEGLHDSFMTESDINRLYAALGRAPIRLNGGFRILSNMPQVLNADFSGAALELDGRICRYEGTDEDAPLFSYVYFLAVIPDEAATGLALQSMGMAYDLGGAKFDAEGLRRDLSYVYTTADGSYRYERCDYRIREYGRLQRNSNTAIFVVGALYIAVVFVFMAMAILALKTLSGLSEDRQRYRVLFRLGAGEREQSRTLFRQTFSFFFLPFALPLLLSIPTGVICAQIMRLGGYPEQVGVVYASAALVALVLTVIYVLYFTATYRIARRNILHTTG